MIGVQGCVFIPNNTAPDGTINRALQAVNSGVNDLLTGWMGKWFRKWKRVMTSVLTSLIIVLGILTTVGCYIIPCVWGLL
jgi:hypothetical protein